MMDWRLKPCSLRDSNVVVDRLSSLPDEVLIQILSLLPTKYAVATCLLSRRLFSVLPWIPVLDFDDLPISYCVKQPFKIECFPTYVTFVQSVLGAYKSQYLTKFSLRVGTDFITKHFHRCYCNVGCVSDYCLPDLKFTQINSWIHFPLQRCGLRELDLRIQARCEGQLPPEIFTCETLEVLKLDVNLGFDRVSTFCLPILKLLQLRASLIGDDGFLTRLVSSCPVLEDLTVEAFWFDAYLIKITSTSLRRLCLNVNKLDDSANTDFVQIDTPNLEYFKYYDNVALEYSFQNMHSLVKAAICIYDESGSDMDDFEQILNLIRPLSNVQHLKLSGMCTEHLNIFVEVKDKLPLFRNLKYLELGNPGSNCWDNILLAMLNCSPMLETLAFPQGLSSEETELTESHSFRESLDLEREFFRTTQAIPLCCKSHLKSIVIKECIGTEREIELIQFLLRHALVLKELILWRAEGPMSYSAFSTANLAANHVRLESTLKNYPRASVNCSIQVL